MWSSREILVTGIREMGCMTVRVWQRHEIKTKGVLQTWGNVAEPLTEEELANNEKRIEHWPGIAAHFLTVLSIQLCQAEKFSYGHVLAHLH